MIGVCRLLAAISPTTAVPSIPSRPAKPYSFHSFTGIKLSKGGICHLAMPWRAGTLKDATEVEIETDNVADMAEVNGLPDLERKLEGKEEEEIMEGLHSHGEFFGRKKRKAVDLDVNNYDRFKMNNGREVFEEKAYLVSVESKDTEADNFGIEESLKELAQLADTAGLLVVGMTHQKQLRNLEKAFGGDIRVCDRTSLILDIFNQRAATHEAALQVSLAQMEYQLPRLTKMWTHLERQAGGKVKGMGEKQIEVDKRILRTQIGILKKELESVRKHRKLYRNRRLSVPIPVVSLVGYTNAGKSTLLNHLTGADVLAEDRLFATLDPTTRKVQMSNGRQFLLTDTVGFIQKLPTMLVAAFRATLEEISESSLLVHVVDISHPLAQQQTDAVDKILQELDVASIPKLVVWNKVDKTDDPCKVKREAEKKGILCISATIGDGLEQFCDAVQAKLRESMVLVEAFLPYGKSDLLNTIHHVGIVEKTEYMENGTRVRAYVPLPLARSLTPMRQQVASAL
ncbi:uncharacterized protein LOC110116174 isoform X2 [Dendrobium catenatum]|uniref:uncharacterized protein LOC110116174 isoform X2 n=1 Tax=Dendrobium catenatum TaxID=906689 RepID=UPI0009F4C602|nr:uncharacterized protein LOC110116174 isoform X2 [Dendrobium catenatum]